VFKMLVFQPLVELSLGVAFRLRLRSLNSRPVRNQPRINAAKELNCINSASSAGVQVCMRRSDHLHGRNADAKD
jgi:hypothetical protein